jgi:hypothetical protein
MQGKDRAIGGVREYIFVWDVTTEQLIKQFKAHYARIIHMSSLTEGIKGIVSRDFIGSFLVLLDSLLIPPYLVRLSLYEPFLFCVNGD